MACLDIDIGNTRAKWRIVPCGLSAAQQLQQAAAINVVSTFDGHGDAGVLVEGLKSAFKNLDQRLLRVRVASVRSAEFERKLSNGFEQWLGVRPEFVRTQGQSLAEGISVKNSYTEPKSMGVDRWCAIVAAAVRCSGRPCCVVDAGSAMTIECINTMAQHIGGYILPGFETQVKALLAKTDRVDAQDVLEAPFAAGKVTAPANNTLGAVRSGVWLNLAGAIRDVCRRMESDALSLVICGGNGPMLYQILEGDTGCDIYLSDSLVFDGICYLLP